MAGVGHNSGSESQEGAVVVRISLPTALLRLFPGSPGQLKIEARDVRGVIDELDKRWPGMRDRLMDSSPKIRRHLNIFVGEDRAKLETPLRSGDRVTIMTAMSGG